MVAGRVIGTSIAMALLLCQAASAANVPVLTQDGRIERRADPGVAARERTPGAHLGERRRAAASPRARVAKGRARTVVRELRRLYDEGLLDRDAYLDRRSDYLSFRAAVRRFGGRRRIDMAGVLGVVDGIAARGALTPSRLPALWLTMERNREWWNAGPLLSSGSRVSFEGSELVWQYVPGQGLHLHPLATFGKLNALWRARGGRDRLELLLDELLALPAERAGGLAWEYHFAFGGGRPPWVSGLAQGTGLQAIARAAAKLGRAAEVLPVARRGLGIFRTAPPEGVRAEGSGGIHYLQYSYAPSLRVLNGFVQSLVGLYDFAVLAADVEAQGLFLEGLAAARHEVPAHDTGAWSLYALGSSTSESTLGYHVLLRDFLASLCDRVAEPVFCDAEQRFTAYLSQPPALALVTRRLRGGRAGALRFELSKVSTVTVRVSRGRSTVLSRLAVLGRGLRRQSLTVPRRPGTYAVTLTATDLAGNRATLDATVEVLRPRRRS